MYRPNSTKENRVRYFVVVHRQQQLALSTNVLVIHHWYMRWKLGELVCLNWRMVYLVIDSINNADLPAHFKESTLINGNNWLLDFPTPRRLPFGATNKHAAVARACTDQRYPFKYFVNLRETRLCPPGIKAKGDRSQTALPACAMLIDHSAKFKLFRMCQKACVKCHQGTHETREPVVRVMWSSISFTRQSASSAERPNKNVKEATNLSHFTENGKFSR